MTAVATPRDLYLQLEARLGELRDVQDKTLALVREYQLHDSSVLETDTVGEPISGPEAFDAALLNLGRLDLALDAADEAFQETLVYTSRLRVKD
ncbi:MAG: hypothetical protein WAW17_14015 [Rhodococcus sp. (in: high G+C Gram-positive bacteria)]|uniref:hypothetical protein n=1 Tax=Rhodococcus sp. TaxID=1831 RepID=UPI003BB014BD